MNVKHTPGPWCVDFGDRTRSSEIWSKGGVIVADICSHVLGAAEHGDALLIVEAPTLFDLAKRLEPWLTAFEEREGRSAPSLFLEQLRESIARIEGRAPVARVPGRPL